MIIEGVAKEVEVRVRFLFVAVGMRRRAACLKLSGASGAIGDLELGEGASSRSYGDIRRARDAQSEARTRCSNQV